MTACEKMSVHVVVVDCGVLIEKEKCITMSFNCGF